MKLYSSHLLLMAVFLLLPDLRRLANVLVLNRPTEPVVLRTPFQKPWMERAHLPVKALFIAGAVGVTGHNAWDATNTYGDDAPGHHLYGLYEVETFTRNGQELLPTGSEASRWKMLTVNRLGRRLTIRAMDESALRYTVQDDAEKKTLTLSPFTEPGAKSEGAKVVLTYTRQDPERLVLEGPIGNDRVSARLRKIDTSSKFLLLNRGFHWVNEYPFNR